MRSRHIANADPAEHPAFDHGGTVQLRHAWHPRRFRVYGEGPKVTIRVDEPPVLGQRDAEQLADPERDGGGRDADRELAQSGFQRGLARDDRDQSPDAEQRRSAQQT